MRDVAGLTFLGYDQGADWGCSAISPIYAIGPGIVTVAREALAAASAGTEALYVSVDLAVVAGVDDPVGLSASDLSVALGIVSASRLVGADFCGVAPGGDGGALGGGGTGAGRPVSWPTALCAKPLS